MSSLSFTMSSVTKETIIPVLRVIADVQVSDDDLSKGFEYPYHASCALLSLTELQARRAPDVLSTAHGRRDRGL